MSGCSRGERQNKTAISVSRSTSSLSVQTYANTFFFSYIPVVCFFPCVSESPHSEPGALDEVDNGTGPNTSDEGEE